MDIDTLLTSFKNDEHLRFLPQIADKLTSVISDMLAELQTDPEEDDLPGLLAILDECRESYHLFRESLSNYSEGSTHQDQYRVQWIQCLETIERNEEGIERSVRSLEWYRCRLGAHSREVLALTSGVVTPLQHFESVLPDEPTIEEMQEWVENDNTGSLPMAVGQAYCNKFDRMIEDSRERVAESRRTLNEIQSKHLSAERFCAGLVYLADEAEEGIQRCTEEAERVRALHRRKHKRRRTSCEGGSEKKARSEPMVLAVRRREVLQQGVA